jgi:hypothetical protein
MLEEKRGSFEGAIRIPLHASSFLFNDLAFLVIPRKFLRFLTPLFSVPTDRASLQLKTEKLQFFRGASRSRFNGGRRILRMNGSWSESPRPKRTR